MQTEKNLGSCGQEYLQTQEELLAGHCRERCAAQRLVCPEQFAHGQGEVVSVAQESGKVPQKTTNSRQELRENVAID